MKSHVLLKTLESVSFKRKSGSKTIAFFFFPVSLMALSLASAEVRNRGWAHLPLCYGGPEAGNLLI